MLEEFKEHINFNLSFLNNSNLLIAVSGGIDSVVLTHLCHQLKLNFSLAHCNFNLRGSESDADESFVISLAKSLNAEVFLESFDTTIYAREYKVSIQMAARELRYIWLQQLAKQLNFDFILTAHHADDNLETFLINLSRGTGLDGLIGIPEINKNIVRPLLPFSREQITEWAKYNNIEWKQDSSNLTDKYLRNKLRLDIIPKLKELNPVFLDNVVKTQEFLQESRIIIEDRLDNVSDEVITNISENEIHFNIEKISNLSNPKAYLYELLKLYGFTDWDDVCNLLNAQSGKQLFSKSHRLIKDRLVLILTNLQEKDDVSTTIKNSTKEISYPNGKLFIKDVKAIGKSTSSDIHIDKDLLKFPIILRKWKEGDYFYPFGMQGKKKLSKYFKDEKLSLVDKENTWVLCSKNDVVWIVNHRLDDRFKVTEQTKKILKISTQE